MSFDSSIMEAVADHRAAWATAVAEAVLTVGTTPQVLVACGLVATVAVVVLRAYRPALAAVAALAVAVVASVILKQLVGRPRPPAHLALVTVGGDAFPSTHAAATSAVAVAVLVATPWHTARSALGAAALLAALVALVGACMVYLGAHWPSDVLAGWLLGVAVGFALGVCVRNAPGRTPSPDLARRPGPAALPGSLLNAGRDQPESRRPDL